MLTLQMLILKSCAPEGAPTKKQKTGKDGGRCPPYEIRSYCRANKCNASADYFGGCAALIHPANAAKSGEQLL